MLVLKIILNEKIIELKYLFNKLIKYLTQLIFIKTEKYLRLIR